MFRCITCGKLMDDLIRSQCQECTPQLHADHKFALDTIARLSADFEAQTGKSSLADFDNFENFIAGKLADTEDGNRFAAICQKHDKIKETHHG